MTGSELLRLLKKHGCTFVRNGGRHDIYKNPKGDEFPVGRHLKEEVKTATLHTILKQAGIKGK